MLTKMPLLWESSPLQWSAAKKIKTEELAKENDEKENVAVLLVVGGPNINKIITSSHGILGV